jgi:hypothetical protein
MAFAWIVWPHPWHGIREAGLMLANSQYNPVGATL